MSFTDEFTVPLEVLVYNFDLLFFWYKYIYIQCCVFKSKRQNAINAHFPMNWFVYMARSNLVNRLMPPVPLKFRDFISHPPLPIPSA